TAAEPAPAIRSAADAPAMARLTSDRVEPGPERRRMTESNDEEPMRARYRRRALAESRRGPPQQNDRFGLVLFGRRQNAGLGALDDLARDLAQFPVGSLRQHAEGLEGGVVVALVAHHQDALGLLDHGAR